jgi:hypothetical protein
MNYKPLTDTEFAMIALDAGRESALRRDVTPSTLIGRAVEAAVISRVAWKAGWKLVPIELTPEMLRVMRKQLSGAMMGPHMRPRAENIWQAALGAAPEPTP